MGARVEKKNSKERDHRYSQKGIKYEMAQSFNFQMGKNGAQRSFDLLKIIQPY